MTQTPLDPFALARGVHIEDLRVIRRTRQVAVKGPVVSRTLIEMMYAAQPRTDWDAEAAGHKAALVGTGWVDDDGILTDSGRQLRADLTTDQCVVFICSSSRRGQLRGRIVVGATMAMAIVDSHVSQWGGDGIAGTETVIVEAMPKGALPLLLAKWGGLVPSWSFGDGKESLDARGIMRRLQDPNEPVPADVSDDVAAMWQQPWTQWSITCPDGAWDRLYISAGERGHYVVKHDDDGRVRLIPRPSSLLWGDLLAMASLRGSSTPSW